MSVYSAFETSSDLETKGFVADLGEAGEYTLARAGGKNENYTNTLSEKMRPLRAGIDAGVIPANVITKVFVEVFVDTVLLGWTKVTGRDKQPIEFNRANAVKLLIELPELLERLLKISMDFGNFKKAALDAAVGNSSGASSGS